MQVKLVPVLQSLRSLYDVDDAMSRFNAYRSLMLDGVQFLPLGAFSPMGRSQPRYLDALLELDAETIAQEAASNAASRLAFLPDTYSLLLVVVDAPNDKNTWTNRYATDAEWRFTRKYDTEPQLAGARATHHQQQHDRWVTVQLWTHKTPPTARYIAEETQASIYRAAHQKWHGGLPMTLGAMMVQEGRAQLFAGVEDRALAKGAISAARLYDTLESHAETSHYPTCLAAMYGDEGAAEMGYDFELGLPPFAGFDVGLANAMKELRGDDFEPFFTTLARE